MTESHDPSPTSPASPASSGSSEADRFERVAADFDRLVRAVPAERWDATSPCDGWSAADVLVHVAETERDLLVRMGFDAPDLDGLEPLTAWERMRAVMSTAMADPVRANDPFDGFFGPTTFGRTVDQFYSFDLVIHRWDIARATGLVEHQHIDDDLIGWLRASAEGFGEAIRMPGICGPEVVVGDGASAQHQLLAWLGRDPR